MTLKIKIKKNKRKAFFLDRDGVIIKHKHYMYKKKDLRFLPGVIKGIKLLNQKKFLVIIVTNQAGIAKGYLKLKDMHELHKYMIKILLKHNCFIDDIFYCPFHPNGIVTKYKKSSIDRKPNPGMINKAVKKWNINKQNSFMMGDQLTDMQAAKKANIKFFYKSKYSFLQQVKNII